jgi:hypothetical protein
MNQLPVRSCSLASCEFDSRSRDVRGALRCVWSLLCAHRRNSGSFAPPGACEGKVGRGYPDPIRDLPPSGGSDRGRTVHAQSLYPSGDNDWDFGPRTNAFLFGGGCSEPGPRGRSNPSGDGSRDFTVHARSFLSSGKNERDSGSCTEVGSFGRRQPGPGSVHGRLTLRRKANGTRSTHDGRIPRETMITHGSSDLRVRATRTIGSRKDIKHRGAWWPGSRFAQDAPTLGKE